MKIRTIAAAPLAALAIVCGFALPASANSGCAGTSGCSVYKLAGLTAGDRNASPNGVALGSPNTAAAGVKLELRNYSITREAEQFALQPNGELQLGGTTLCVTGWANEAVLEQCSAATPTIWKSQNWTLSGEVFTNADGRSLYVPSTAAYTTVVTSTTQRAFWTRNVVTP